MPPDRNEQLLRRNSQSRGRIPIPLSSRIAASLFTRVVADGIIRREADSEQIGATLWVLAKMVGCHTGLSKTLQQFVSERRAVHRLIEVPADLRWHRVRKLAANFTRYAGELASSNGVHCLPAYESIACLRRNKQRNVRALPKSRCGVVDDALFNWVSEPSSPQSSQSPAAHTLRLSPQACTSAQTHSSPKSFISQRLFACDPMMETFQSPGRSESACSMCALISARCPRSEPV
jgi:hypothetical protein